MIPVSAIDCAPKRPKVNAEVSSPVPVVGRKARAASACFCATKPEGVKPEPKISLAVTFLSERIP